MHRGTFRNLRSILATAFIVAAGALHVEMADADSLAIIERQFRTLPAESRRLTGPLFWLHGDESPERLEAYLQKVAEGGHGCFTAESRPHKDWLGPGWYRDLAVCLAKAKKLDLKMWIFDEQWWPSGEVGGKVPRQYGSKYIHVESVGLEGPLHHTQRVTTDKLIAVVAGRETADGIDGSSLVDLTSQIADGVLDWDAPAGKWKVMTFTWAYGDGRRGRLLVDGASQDAVDWYIRTVYQPHYDRFSDDFGKTILGYFYDEPETLGDWGTEVFPVLGQRGIDWKKPLVSWKFKLTGEEHVAANYQYRDAFAEAWGRTLYGGLSDWCRSHKVQSIGHFLEHSFGYLNPRLCAGNMFQLQKYSDMGGIDLVCQQFYPGSKDPRYCQMAKLGSSIAHVYAKTDDLAMCEIFGAYGQELTYQQMKWLTDHMQVRGINFMIPHAFNPRAPHDRDCPPYFYNDGYEPRWPLYRPYADYTTRLSLMLSGGHHVCPVALLYLGHSRHVGKALTPEDMTSALQDALFDCDWLPYDVFERDTKIADGKIQLHRERFSILVVPPVEVIPPATLAKAHEFFESGGIVVGYGFLPSRPAALGKDSADIAALRQAIWGETGKPGLKVCKTSTAGGRSYFLPEKPTSQQIQQVLTVDAGIHPTLEVLEGDTHDWLHVLHRVKAGCDVFLVCNQKDEGSVGRFRLRAHARGVPECWDAMRNEITSVPSTRVDEDTVDLSVTLEPMESVLLVFQSNSVKRPIRIEADTPVARDPVHVSRVPIPAGELPPIMPPADVNKALPFDGCPWIWYGNENGMAAPRGLRYFRRRLEIPEDVSVVDAKIRMTADNGYVLFVNGQEMGRGHSFMAAQIIDLTDLLHAGSNVLAVEVGNGGSEPNPAGLLGCYRIKLTTGIVVTKKIDATWRSHNFQLPGWNEVDFDDSEWIFAKAFAVAGDPPWGDIDGVQSMTLSPVKPDPFFGRFDIPSDCDLSRYRAYVEMSGMKTPAAAVTVNGHRMGGVIGAPLRVNVSSCLRVGRNRVRIEPYAPESATIVFYERTR